MTVIWYILGCLFAAIFGAAAMALFHMAKHTDIDNGVEPSLSQSDRFVVMTNAEKLSKVLTEEELGDFRMVCGSIPDEHCKKCSDCEQCRADWLKMEVE